jgi:SAM-dependent methyltransferase
MDQEAGGQIAGPDLDRTVFDAYYFANCCGRPYRRDEHWLAFFGRIAESIATTIQPRRVLDAGCAMGLLVEALRSRDIDAEGIDLSSYAIAHVYDPIRPFCRQGSITEELSDRYDLIVSIEVLEHMPPREGEAAIANFCRHTSDVLFSSSPTDYREPTHVNVQPTEYWAELFARHGFYRDVDFDASFVTPWAVRFRRSTEPVSRIVRHYERRFSALSAESHDARSFSREVRERAETEAAALRGELSAARTAVDEAHAQLTQQAVAADSVAARVASLESALARAEHELAQARATIHDMERSAFWRIRSVWARISRVAGRPT